MTISAITPEELRNLTVYYHFAETRFGSIVVASTGKGVCYLGFVDENVLPADLRRRFPTAVFIQQEDEFQNTAIAALAANSAEGVKCHLKCTAFQLEVWQELLKMKIGELTSYGELARKINCPKASRAVGTAVGSNPIALLIPCHRVIPASGAWGNYRWGKERKRSILEWEYQHADDAE